MAEKILALLIAFVGGVALTALVGTKMINLALRHSAPVRKQIRDALDREDARHAIVSAPTDDPIALGFKAGVEAASRDGKCELCIDLIDKPHIDARSARRWLACPNQAARTVWRNGHELRVCEEHFQRAWAKDSPR